MFSSSFSFVTTVCLSMVNGLVIISILCFSQDRSHQKDLESLGLQLMEKNENAIEAHIAFGYLSRSLGQYFNLGSILYLVFPCV